uniref:Uncharacterized protein n=1 Tax=Oryza rufipogon TaxID=4529 RepID=A0A0E0R060_ORYRU
MSTTSIADPIRSDSDRISKNRIRETLPGPGCRRPPRIQDERRLPRNSTKNTPCPSNAQRDLALHQPPPEKIEFWRDLGGEESEAAACKPRNRDEGEEHEIIIRSEEKNRKKKGIKPRASGSQVRLQMLSRLKRREDSQQRRRKKKVSSKIANRIGSRRKRREEKRATNLTSRRSPLLRHGLFFFLLSRQEQKAGGEANCSWRVEYWSIERRKKKIPREINFSRSKTWILYVVVLGFPMGEKPLLCFALFFFFFFYRVEMASCIRALSGFRVSGFRGLDSFPGRADGSALTWPNLKVSVLNC